MIPFPVRSSYDFRLAASKPTASAKPVVGFCALCAVVAPKVYAYIVAVSETLLIALASGVPVVASLAASLRKFIEARRSSVQVTVKRSGDVIKLDVTNVEDAERLIKIFLTEYPAGQSEPTPVEYTEESPAERSDDS